MSDVLNDPTRTKPPEELTLSTPSPDPPGTLTAAPPTDRLGTLDLPVAPPPDVSAPPGYEILGELGRGGMGAVYKARQVNLNRVVALKVVPGGGRVAVARFWAEAEVVAAVRHPNVVQVYEFGESSSSPYMAMEFCPGGSLAERPKPLPPREAAALVEKIARGVAAAHAEGTVHRDLKPGNVLFDAAGEPKVADFGLAKRTAVDLTSTRAVMGTPAYMAPEQAEGRTKFAGPPADVWALGVILQELVAGRRPFDGDTAQAVMFQIMTAQPPALRTLVRTAPRDLETVVAKCLTKEPELRYPTAADLADDLARFGRGDPTAARPVGAVERAARWARRKPAAAAAWGMSAVAVGVALAAAMAVGLWRDAERARGEAEAANGRLVVEKRQTEDARTEAERLRDDALTQRGLAEKARAGEKAARNEAEREREKLAVFEYGRTIQLAHQEWRDFNFLAMRSLLDGTDPKLRGWEWQYLNRLHDPSLLALKGHTIAVYAASFSPDGSRVVTAGLDAGLHAARVWDAKTGAAVLALKGHASSVYAASFSPDGSRVVTASEDNTARVWDAKTGAEVLALKGHTSGVSAACWSPDGSRVVTGSSDETARVWDAKTGAEVLTLKGHTDRVRAACWSPDGARVVTGSSDNTARVWDAKTGAEVLTLKGHALGVLAAAWSPEGMRIVTAGGDGHARVWDARTVTEQVGWLNPSLPVAPLPRPKP